jgi:hypothetical protein
MVKTSVPKKFRLPRYWMPVALANVRLISLIVAVMVTVAVPLPARSAAVRPPTMSSRTVSVPKSTSRVTVMSVMPGLASTSVTWTPLIPNWLSSSPLSLPGMAFTGASLTAVMLMMLVWLFWAPVGMSGVPSLSVQVRVRCGFSP